MRSHILLNPGPVTLSNKVRQALLTPDMCHRENNFAQMAQRIQNKIENVYHEMADKYKAVLLTGSGTSAVEAMLSTFIEKENSSTLILANGVYGERMASILERQGKKTCVLSSDWSDEIQFEEAEKLLSGENDILYIVTVHNETTTGRLNDVKRVTELCKKYNKFLLVDAVSSFGGELFDFLDEYGTVKAVAATANKCLHGTPGVSFVLAEMELLELGKSNSMSLYLDLIPYYQAQKKGFSPFTQAVHNYFALEAALDELEESGGIKARHERYKELSERIQSELNNLGFYTYLRTDDYSSMITSFNVPDYLTYEEIHETCYEAGFIIYAGQGGFEGSMFRIANMGNIQNKDVDRLINVFQKLSQK
ncbi:MAG: aminotransferase class V-fold PLP-dependent enzyme [Kordiimonadaceae bacterium]|jgi:2-aminoethylphosphonate-pyruvate transaminase|nr:aminotransferase class V-fold PLP-dependent enzyme [Kordiimonadaceae bacterium]